MKEDVGPMSIGWVSLSSAATTAIAATTVAHNNEGGCWFIVGRVA